MIDNNIEPKHQAMVDMLVKNPVEIKANMSVRMCDLLHATLGIASESGEIVDAVKKHVIYNQPLDKENLIEELGDLEFYMHQLRQELGITRELTLQANYDKLLLRYPNFKYTDAKAKERLDKALAKTKAP